MTTTVAPADAEAGTAGTGTAAGAAAAGAFSGGGAGPSAHPVLRFLRAVDGAFDRLGDTPTWSMSKDEQREALLLVDRIGSRREELELRVLATADRGDLAADAGATSIAVWLATRTRQTRARCATRAGMARQLEETFHATREALAGGRVNFAQAKAIVTAVNALTREYDDLPADIVPRAEAHLLDLAARFDAIELAVLGKRLFEVVCPEAADATEGEQLAKEEERARRTASLSLHNNGDGTVDGRFRLPVLHADLLKKALEVLTAPRRIGRGRIDPKTGKKLPYPVLLGQGLMELLENHLHPDRLPSTGGSPFTLVVTIGLDALTSGIGAATLETGTRISAGQARRLACTAGLIPAVLGGESVVLDLGREQRLFDRHQKIAMNLHYGGCAAEGCDRPPSWTEGHHLDPWAHGGTTDLANGIPLCPPHHHMADHPQEWTIHTQPSGKVRFSRRQ
jgi:hypothetical protein